MKKITITKKLKVFSIDDIKEAAQYIGEDGYFADSIEDFQNASTVHTLDKIEITIMNNAWIFQSENGGYKLFAIIED